MQHILKIGDKVVDVGARKKHGLKYLRITCGRKCLTVKMTDAQTKALAAALTAEDLS